MKITFEILIIISCLLGWALPKKENEFGHHHSNHHTLHDKSLMKPGNSNIIPGIIVSGAIIMSDHGDSGVEKPVELPHANISTTNSELDVISARIHNAHLLMSQLPFPVTEWSGVFTTPCPHFPDGHKTERGVALAQYRIWKEFIYFDTELIYRFNQSKTNPLNHSSSPDFKLTSLDGNYVIYPHNNTYYKHGQLFGERDILVVFEDDAESAIMDTNTTVVEELSQMNTDILFLGELCDLLFFVLPCSCLSSQ